MSDAMAAGTALERVPETKVLVGEIDSTMSRLMLAARQAENLKPLTEEEAAGMTVAWSSWSHVNETRATEIVVHLAARLGTDAPLVRLATEEDRRLYGFHCTSDFYAWRTATIYLTSRTTRSGVVLLDARVVDNVIHEFAHHLNERRGGRRGHTVDFYHCLLLCISVCPIGEYDWSREYIHLHGWASRDGFDIIESREYRERMKELGIGAAA